MKRRAGGTTNLSISLPSEDVKILRRRAKRVYGGNVSRVVSEAIRYVAYEEGRDALIESFGGKGKLSPAEARQLDAAWRLSAKKSA
jgi:CO/xanthine dehydrogenase Mo-binding subunit